jgi:hypothetical protein
MGFEVSTTGSVLTFPPDSKYAGLEVRLDEAPIGLLTDVMESYVKFTAGNISADEAARLVKSLTEGFASVLEEWNAERKGVPVPATLDGVRSLGPTFLMGVIGAWVTGTVGVDDDLGKGSPSGGSSAEGAAAMAALSSSLPSSPQQKF